MGFEGSTGGRAHALPAWRAALLLVVASTLTAACESRTPMRIRPGPVVESSTIARSSEFMGKVAVMPFYPVSPSGRSIGGSTQQVNWENAALISGYFAEALAAQGIEVVPASDLEQAFAAQGQPVPRLDARTAAVRAHEDFGATAVVVGKVSRWRERQGGAAGATGPASIAFEVALHQAPTGRRLWTGRFDETQQSITENILRARQYPGSGTRWMTASEFARWGASEVARSMNAAP